MAYESTFRQIRFTEAGEARLTQLLAQEKLTGLEEGEMMGLAQHAPQRLKDQASQRQTRRRANRDAKKRAKAAGGKQGGKTSNDDDVWADFLAGR